MAFLQSEPPREPFLNAPACVLWLIAAIALAHVARVWAPAPWPDALLTQFAFVPARYAAPAGGLLALAVPFVSHQFLHADFIHLGVNSLWLLAFGPVVARRYGAVFFLLFFAVCGVAGAAAYLVLNWGSPVGIIGASGAISGLMGAAIRMFPWPGARLARPLAPILSRPVVLFTVIWFATNLLLGLTGFGAEGEIHQIAWQAHVGGYFAGLVLAGVFDAWSSRRKAKVPSTG